MNDYARTHSDYWSRPENCGKSSINDVEDVVQRILTSCGGGKILDVGCGMGHLVRALLCKCVDANGMDVAQNAVDYCNSVVPSRFVTGSILNISYPESYFDTVVTTNILEYLSESDIPKALAELHRVARRYVYVLLSTSSDQEPTGQLTLHDREWWEKRFFLAGFRKHPRIQKILPYESLEQEPLHITLIFEKLPCEVNDKYPLELLNSQRQLHMDMLRDTGRRSDAHIARYDLACRFVRPGDIVLDLACGLGYGCAILALGSPAMRVIGVDTSPFALRYARDNFAINSLVVEFHESDAIDLSFLPDESVDYVVSFETLEHVSDTEAFLSEIKRVLKPSGRIMVSVPNDWTDETGKDPNPHHLHVYTWSSMHEEIAGYFRVEKAFAQIAGGALKLAEGKRVLKEVTVSSSQDEQAEWWLMLAMKDPVTADRSQYRETSFPNYSSQHAYNITAFGRDYDNPWLVKGMVSIGMRMTSDVELQSMAEEVLNTGRPGSADVGAAICVIAYRVLHREGAKIEQIYSILESIRRYHSQADDNPNAWRWRISNQYVAAHLFLKMGDREKARMAFQLCGEMDSLKFSPLLATKTVDAWFYAGLLAAGDNHIDEARGCWVKALREAERVVHSDWLNVWGSAEQPASFGLPEMSQLLDLSSRAGYALLAIDDWSHRPGWSWDQAHWCTARNLESWRSMADSRMVWIEYLKQQLALHAQWLSERDQQIQFLLNTISWKITKPLRYISLLFRKIIAAITKYANP